MTFEQASNVLRSNGQEQVLAFWEGLDRDGQARLLGQIAGLDIDAISRMRSALSAPDDAPGGPGNLAPAPVVELGEMAERERNEALSAYGESALARGEVGVLLVAGGQGSRLGFEGPKGAYPIGPLSNVSLFEIHARKILALERRHATRIPFYIMTSEANDAATREHFLAHAYFGLCPDRVRFFTQGMWPALSPDGRLLMDAPDHIFMSPDGHGGTLAALKRTGMFTDMEQRGLHSVFYFQVDNPLVEIADPSFVGIHIKTGAEVSTKVCAKRDAREGLGVAVQSGNRSRMVEYSELTPEQMDARQRDGRLNLLFGSVAIHIFSVAFLKQEAERDNMPLHRAFKKVAHLGEDGRPITPDKPNAYKFEKFIFDVIPHASNALFVEFDRASEFSPVKNSEGQDSPETARRDMIRKQSAWLEACGIAIPRDSFGEPRFKVEIDPGRVPDPTRLADILPPGFTLDGDLLLRGDPPAGG